MDATTAVQQQPPLSPVKTSAPPALAAPTTATSPTAAPPGRGASDPDPATGTSSSNTPRETTSEATTDMSTATAASTSPAVPPHKPATNHGLTMNIPASALTGGASAVAQHAMKDAPMVNAAAASAAMMTSSAMTPTTTNYAVNPQLVKASGTLTPMGEDKISTAGPSGTAKVKQTKKKAAAGGDGETVKKATPRSRAKADPNKAEKRKASPARASNSAASTPSNGAAGTPSASVAPSAPPASTPSAAAMASAQMPVNTSNDQQHELPPSLDTELRKEYLQRIYRQLQMTHRNQDDSMVRRLATNIEIDICRRAATRGDYVTYMNQQINSLMQAELTNGTVGLQSSLYVPGVGVPASSNGMNVSVSSNGAIGQPGLHQNGPAAYKQSGSISSSSGDIGQQTSSGTQGSFMSLLSSQAGPAQPQYDATRGGQQYSAQGLPGHPRQPQYGAMTSTSSYPAQGQGLPQASAMKIDTQGDPTSQQAPYGGQRVPSQPSLTSAPPEFAAQFQRLDRNGLLDLLWTQHKTVIQYQRRLAQLEVQVGSRQVPGGLGAANNMQPTPGAVPSAYYNASPRQPGVAPVPPGLSAEAEAQRARDRANTRAGHHPGQYGQPNYPPSKPTATPTGGVNPPLYWEKVRYLSEAYLRHLYVAHQALSQHTAPQNSAQGAKAENVKHNISLACQILSESPTNVQPRPLEVLDSIERFIQTTVVPIVRKVSPQVLGQMSAGAPNMASALQMRTQQPPNEINDSSRNPVAPSALSQPVSVPSSSEPLAYSNGQHPPVAPQPTATTPNAKGTAKAKGGAKSGGKKSPSGGPKKATTPKTAGPKATAKGGAKKSPKAGAKQAAAAKTVISTNGTPAEANSLLSAGQSQPAAESANPEPTSAATERPESMAAKAGTMMDDDSLNDFSDFADLDFDDDLQDPLVKVASNKENAAGVNSRKRSIEDV